MRRAKKKVTGLGSLDDLVERSVATFTPLSDQFCDKLIDIVDNNDTKQSIGEIWKTLTEPVNSSIIETPRLAVLLSAMYGILEFNTVDKKTALTSWTGLPPKDAIEFFKRKKIVSAKEFKALEDSAKAKAFSIAATHQRYVVMEAHQLLSDAIESGESIGQTRRAMRELFRSVGVSNDSNHYINNVFRTNIQASYSEGRYKQQWDARKELPYWRYGTVGDARVRDEHKPLDGLIYPAEHEFWKTYYPPNGFQCRCNVTSLSRYDVNEGDVLTDIPEDIIKPTPGFRSSPASSAEIKRSVSGVSSALNKLNLPGPPVISRSGNTLHEAIGSIAGNNQTDALEQIKKISGLNDSSVLKLLAKNGNCSVLSKGAPSLRKGFARAEVVIPSIHSDGAEQLVSRIASEVGDAKINYGSLVHYVEGKAYLGSTAAINAKGYNATPGLIVSVDTKSAADIETLAELMLNAESGHGSPIRHATDRAYLTLQNVSASDGYTEAYRCEKVVGGKKIIKISKKRLAEYKNTRVLITHNMAEGLDVR